MRNSHIGQHEFGAVFLQKCVFACLQATIAEQQPQFGQVMQELLERYAPPI